MVQPSQSRVGAEPSTSSSYPITLVKRPVPRWSKEERRRLGKWSMGPGWAPLNGWNRKKKTNPRSHFRPLSWHPADRCTAVQVEETETFWVCHSTLSIGTNQTALNLQSFDWSTFFPPLPLCSRSSQLLSSITRIVSAWIFSLLYTYLLDYFPMLACLAAQPPTYLCAAREGNYRFCAIVAGLWRVLLLLVSILSRPFLPQYHNEWFLWGFGERERKRGTTINGNKTNRSQKVFSSVSFKASFSSCPTIHYDYYTQAKPSPSACLSVCRFQPEPTNFFKWLQLEKLNTERERESWVDCSVRTSFLSHKEVLVEIGHFDWLTRSINQLSILPTCTRVCLNKKERRGSRSFVVQCKTCGNPGQAVVRRLG